MTQWDKNVIVEDCMLLTVHCDTQVDITKLILK